MFPKVIIIESETSQCKFTGCNFLGSVVPFCPNITQHPRVEKGILNGDDDSRDDYDYDYDYDNERKAWRIAHNDVRGNKDPSISRVACHAVSFIFSHLGNHKTALIFLIKCFLVYIYESAHRNHLYD